MNLENNNQSSNGVKTERAPQNFEKKSYNTPKLHRYGGLAELVQAQPGIGPDGGAPGIPDDTRT